MTGRDPRKFDPARARLLEAPERERYLPTGRLVLHEVSVEPAMTEVRRLLLDAGLPFHFPLRGILTSENKEN